MLKCKGHMSVGLQACMCVRLYYCRSVIARPALLAPTLDSVELKKAGRFRLKFAQAWSFACRTLAPNFNQIT